MTINNNTLEVEIVDVCSSDTEIFPEEPIYWADACVVVYDVTSSNSLKYAADILHQVQQLRTQNQIPVVLLGNKADLEHRREVLFLVILLSFIICQFACFLSII